MTTTRTSQGPSLHKLLAEHGIHASSVVRNRRTGVYTVKFSAPDIGDFHGKGTDSARVWAARIVEALPLTDIIVCFDSVADWRPGCPIIYATVILVPPAQWSAAR